MTVGKSINSGWFEVKDLWALQKWSVQKQNGKTDRPHGELGVCAMAAYSGLLSEGNGHQEPVCCSSYPPLRLPVCECPWSHVLPFSDGGFITHSACICMCACDLSHLPEAFRESVFWHLTTDSKLGSDSNASSQIGHVFICSAHVKMARSRRKPCDVKVF